MGGSGANNRGSSNVATGRTSLVEGLALAERLVAKSGEEGARTATMHVSDVMNLLVAEQQIAQGAAEPGRSGVRQAVREGAVPAPNAPDVSVEFSWVEQAPPVLELVPEVAAPLPVSAPAVVPSPVAPSVRPAPASIPAPSSRPVRRRSKVRRFFAALLFVAIMGASFYVLLEAMKRQGITLPPELAAARDTVVGLIARLR